MSALSAVLQGAEIAIWIMIISYPIALIISPSSIERRFNLQLGSSSRARWIGVTITLFITTLFLIVMSVT
jgi:hypothetical protein